MREHTVPGDPTLAVRDLGGDRPPLVLLHGAGGDSAGLLPLAERLRGAYRVVLPDLRGHGRSGAAPWSWAGALDDLARVVAALGLDRPAVVGGSLGGMLAARWAARQPECPGAVSLDGLPVPSRPDQLAGLDPTRAAAELARLEAVFAGMAAAMPDPAEADRLRRAMADLDLDAACRALAAPLLLVLATEDLPAQQPFAELYAAYRRGTLARLTAIAARQPRLRLHPLPGASHAMLAERPDRIAELVAGFLAERP
ncbi:alpha/beta fold hydrolase [Micromonospora olivasterospora]|uniref:Pimeloyl-ACP methyl ester carboxylesterase n=1 Tax=Micromonospora olivasterospora TaxID=1880 RepID=A0A562I592_MICOL|nr:alpha/beta hydrolase [Micromonospora olivasterospora]TWH66177.1 pimeloyl-ACP methyl ester carboxylesterase [Micromonospora olivasterospora]